MSPFHEYLSPQVDTKVPYEDHEEAYPGLNPSPRHRDQASVHSRNRDVTWITTSRIPSRNPSIIPGPPPPAVAGPSRPLPVPTSMPPGGFVPSEELDAEYMTVDPEEDFEGWHGAQDSQSQWRKTNPRNFVGGFVSGLKKLPRAVLRKPVRRGTGDTGETGDTLPVYHSPVLDGPGIPDVLYVEASEMPVEHPAPAPSDAHSLYSDGPSYRSHHTGGRSHHSDGRSRRTYADDISHHTFMDGRSHTDGRSHHTSIGQEHTYDTHATVHSTHEPYDPEAGPAPLEHIPVPAEVLSPEAVDLRPSSDYDKMESPLRSPSELSLNSRFLRLGQFFQDLYDLPWVATRITADYIPGEQSRARYGRRAQTTWYPGQQSPVDIDLLAGGRNTPPHHTHSPRDQNRDHPRERVPNSSAARAYFNGRPDGRSGSPVYDRDRSPSPPYSSHHAPVYPHGYAPEYAAQPLYVYPSAIPQHQPRDGTHSSSANAAEQERAPPEMQQARPVYIVAPSPPRPFMPPPPDQVHAPHNTYYPYPVSRPPATYPT